MSKNYKILLSAYACNPNKGSEPGIGWNWALEIVKRGHIVSVLTRQRNKESIDNYFISHEKPNNLEFYYYDFPKPLLFVKKIIGTHLYYSIWQFLSFRKITNLHLLNNFDFSHHITFGSVRFHSSLRKLSIPFFYGPIAGGEHGPRALMKSLPFKDKLVENVRLLSNKLVNYNLFSNKTLNSANMIFPTSVQTLDLIHQKMICKSKVSLAIGINLPEKKFISDQKNPESFNILYAGRLLGWKGIHFALSAYKIANESYSDFNFTILGKGSFKNKLTTLSQDLSIDNKVEWVDWISHDKMNNFYSNHQLFLFPSLHDSGGMVVLEALSHGLPVICLDLGGPGQIVNETCGRVISTKGKTEKEVIKALALAIIELQQNPILLKQLSEGALKRVEEYTWTKSVANVYESIETYMSNNKQVT